MKNEDNDDFEPTEAQLENYYWSGYERGERLGTELANVKRLTGDIQGERQ